MLLTVEDFSCNMEGVSDDYNILDIRVGNCLVNAASDSKELSFSYGYINYSM